jgi:phospholipase/carboxylesterase
MDDINTYLLNNWIVRVRPPKTPLSNRCLILIHGWTGDENSMWIFSSRLPQDCWIIAPRGLYPVDSGGFAWVNITSGQSSNLEEFSRTAQQFLDILPLWFHELGISADFINLMGFSQGAALVYTLVILAPKKFEKAICLSGFLPQGAKSILKPGSLSGLRLFIAHGEEDEMVPIEHAYQARELTQSAGADVSFCQDHIGHKLSPGCFKGLEDFLE